MFLTIKNRGLLITMDSKRTAILAISLVVLMLTQAPMVQAWAWDTHRFIENKAEEVFQIIRSSPITIAFSVSGASSRTRVGEKETGTGWMR